MWSLPDFLKTAEEKWGEGKLVKTELLEKANADIVTANARIKELEAAAIDPKPLHERIAALELEVSAKEATNKGHLKTISTLESNFQTASRQAQQQLIKAGAQAPVIGEPPKDEGSKTFSNRVAAKVALGKTKSTAIADCIKEFPAEYAEWRNGDTSKI